MLQNANLLAKIGADTAENEQHFAEILPIGRRVADGKRTWEATVAYLKPKILAAAPSSPAADFQMKLFVLPFCFLNNRARGRAPPKDSGKACRSL